MKAKVDFRPARGNNKAFYGIRIYPETVDEVQELQVGCNIGFEPVYLEMINNPNDLHYLVRFERERKDYDDD